MVVGVQPGREEDDRDAFPRVTVVIAPVVHLLEIRRIVHLVIERERRGQPAIRIAVDLVELAADPIRSDDVDRVDLARLVVAVSADHVDVQLRDDVRHRHGGIVGEIPRPEEPAFLSRVPDEEQRPLRPRALRERFRKRHHRHRPRSVVVRAVPDAIVGRPRRDAAGRAAAFARLAVEISDVVVMRAERDIRILQTRIGAFHHGDHVLRALHADDVVGHVHVERNRHVVESERRQVVARLGEPLQVVVLHGRAAE